MDTYVKRISIDQTHTIRVALDAGIQYQFNGLCDFDCMDLDLLVRNPDGVPMVTDAGPGGKPTVKLTPGQTGIHARKITMVDSAATMVYVGLGAYRDNN